MMEVRKQDPSNERGKESAPITDITEIRRMRKEEALLSGNRSLPYLFIKRAFDLTASALGMIVLSPVFIAAAVAIKVEDPKGKVFYSQARTGYLGRKFHCHNLRWMQVVCELHKIQATIQTIICRRYTEFLLSSDFRHSIAGFAGVFAA